MLVLLLHLAEARQNSIHIAGLIGVRHGVVERFQLVMQIAQASAAGNGLVEHRTALHFLHILAEITDRELLGN